MSFPNVLFSELIFNLNTGQFKGGVFRKIKPSFLITQRNTVSQKEGFVKLKLRREV